MDKESEEVFKDDTDISESAKIAAISPSQKIELTSELVIIDKTKFSQLKEKFPNEPEESLARFLVARNYDVDMAAAQLQKHIVWRSSFLPVRKSSCLNEISKGKAYIHGHDKDGHPLIVFNVRLNWPKERDFDEQVRMSVWWVQQAIASLPPDKSKFTLLINRIGSVQGNIDVEIDKAVLTIFQDNFPERLHRCVVYPSGVLFFLLWNIIKFFIDKRTQDKVKTVLYLAGVQEYIDDEFIPVEMVTTIVD